MNKYTVRRIAALAILLILFVVGIRYFKGSTNSQKQNNTTTQTTLGKSTTAKSTSKTKSTYGSWDSSNLNFKITDVKEDGTYSSKNDVASYIAKFNKLPKNFIKKKEAEKKGWVPSEGNLWDVTEHMSIGADIFMNAEGLLEKKTGRKYYECDIDYKGGPRNAKRIIYSNDGMIFYTDDHYQSFERLK